MLIYRLYYLYFLVGNPPRTAAAAGRTSGTTTTNGVVRTAADFEDSADEEIERRNAGIFGDHTLDGSAELFCKSVEGIAADHSVVNRIGTAVAVFSCTVVAVAAATSAGTARATSSARTAAGITTGIAR
jgi:hypothetical protein